LVVDYSKLNYYLYSKLKNMQKVKNGDTVTVNYTGKFEDGSIFDSSLSEGREPLKATLGQNQLIPGFEKGIIDMVIGDKKTIEIEPAEAYGEINPEAIIDVPKEQFPQDVEVGQVLQGQSPQGMFIVKVLEVNDSTVKVDHNHPMAGKKLIFDLELVSIG
jgi:FKBP-type peptidyl-prolyl cis-trans isomerase 2